MRVVISSNFELVSIHSYMLVNMISELKVVNRKPSACWPFHCAGFTELEKCFVVLEEPLELFGSFKIWLGRLRHQLVPNIHKSKVLAVELLFVHVRVNAQTHLEHVPCVFNRLAHLMMFFGWAADVLVEAACFIKTNMPSWPHKALENQSTSVQQKFKGVYSNHLRVEQGKEFE